MGNFRYSFVIPFYKGEFFIQKFKTLLETSDKFSRCNFYLVDDSGTKENFKLFENIVTKFPNVQYHALNQNMGQHYASALGIKEASGDILITLDQDFIPYLDKIYDEVINQVPHKKEIIYSVLEKRKRNFLRMLPSKIILFVIQIFGRTNLKGIYSIRILNKVDVKDIKLSPHIILDLEILKSGFSIKYLQSEIKLKEMSSSYSFFKLFLVFLNISTFYSRLFEISFIISIILIPFNINISLASLLFSLPLIYKWWIQKTL